MMNKTSSTDRDSGFTRFRRRVLLLVGTLVFVVLTLALLWLAGNVFLLIFAGILLAVFLRGISDWLSKRSSLSDGWALALTMLGLLLLFAAGAWLIGSDVVREAGQLRQQLPRSLERLEQNIEQYEWGKQLLGQTSRANELIPEKSEIAAKATGVFSTTFGALAMLVVFLFLGLFLAASPELYVTGVIRLIPINKRARARQVLSAAGSALRWWLLGKIAAMIVVGVLTALGLAWLGVQPALTLGLLAAVLTFIPNFGPILSAVPAVLLALTDGPVKALYVIILYIAIQTVESYLLTPLVQQRTVSLPPALTISAQLLLGILAGGMGVIVATPLTAALLVFIRMLYIEDVLGDEES
jgi:predicted PurR-regulated permease PerM